MAPAQQPTEAPGLELNCCLENKVQSDFWGSRQDTPTNCVPAVDEVRSAHQCPLEHCPVVVSPHEAEGRAVFPAVDTAQCLAGLE